MKFKLIEQRENPYPNEKVITNYSGHKIKRCPAKFGGSPVGKYIDGGLYIHKNYADAQIPADKLKLAKEYLDKYLKTLGDNFKYECLMYDEKKNIVRFDEAPDFNSQTEPVVGRQIGINFNKLNENGEPLITDKPSKGVWHHKWLWVRDDYTGFDVEKAKKWDEKWMEVVMKSPIGGSRESWEKQLATYNMLDEYKKLNNIE